MSVSGTVESVSVCFGGGWWWWVSSILQLQVGLNGRVDSDDCEGAPWAKSQGHKGKQKRTRP